MATPTFFQVFEGSWTFDSGGLVTGSIGFTFTIDALSNGDVGVDFIAVDGMMYVGEEEFEDFPLAMIGTMYDYPNAYCFVASLYDPYYPVQFKVEGCEGDPEVDVLLNWDGDHEASTATAVTPLDPYFQ